MRRRGRPEELRALVGSAGGEGAGRDGLCWACSIRCINHVRGDCWPCSLADACCLTDLLAGPSFLRFRSLSLCVEGRGRQWRSGGRGRSRWGGRGGGEGSGASSRFWSGVKMEGG